MQVAQDSEALRPGEVADEGEVSGGVVGVKLDTGLSGVSFRRAGNKRPPRPFVF
jgi:hypothetical protein